MNKILDEIKICEETFIDEAVRLAKKGILDQGLDQEYLLNYTLSRQEFNEHQKAILISALILRLAQAEK